MKSIRLFPFLLATLLLDGCVKDLGYYTLTGSTYPDNAGVINGCGGYSNGTIVCLEAIANEGYRFSQWSDGNTYNPRKVVVNGEAEYTAMFERWSNEQIGIITFGDVSWAPSQGGVTLVGYGSSLGVNFTGEGRFTIGLNNVSMGQHHYSHDDLHKQGSIRASTIQYYVGSGIEAPGKSWAIYGEWWGESADVFISALDLNAFKMSIRITAEMYEVEFIEGTWDVVPPTSFRTLVVDFQEVSFGHVVK